MILKISDQILWWTNANKITTEVNIQTYSGDQVYGTEKCDYSFNYIKKFYPQINEIRTIIIWPERNDDFKKDEHQVNVGVFKKISIRKIAILLAIK